MDSNTRTSIEIYHVGKYKRVDFFIHETDFAINRIFETHRPDTVRIYLKKIISINDFNYLLKVIKNYRYSTENVPRSGSNRIKVEKLDFSSCQEVTDDYLNMINNVANIDSVNLTDCTKITSGGIEMLNFCNDINLTNCTQLESVKYGRLVKEKGYYSNNSFPHGRINLTGCVNLRGDTLHLLKDARTIILDNCTQITDDHLIALEPKLNIISLKNTGITGKSFEYFYSCSKTTMYLVKHHIILDKDKNPSLGSVCVDNCVNFDKQYLSYLTPLEVLKAWS